MNEFRITNQGVSALKKFSWFKLFKAAVACFLVVIQFQLRGPTESFKLQEYYSYLMLAFFSFLDALLSFLFMIYVHTNKYKKVFTFRFIACDWEFLLDQLSPFLALMWQFHLLNIPQLFSNTNTNVMLIVRIVFLVVQFSHIPIGILVYRFRLLNGMLDCRKYTHLLNSKYTIYFIDIVVNIILFKTVCPLNYLFVGFWCIGPTLNCAYNPYLGFLFKKAQYQEMKDNDEIAESHFDVRRASLLCILRSGRYLSCGLMSLVSASAICVSIIQTNVIFFVVAIPNILLNYFGLVYTCVLYLKWVYFFKQ
eukprot:NODE_44_length_33449_cov_1.575742.p14 type:complete len:308 gc:universal NODE_44_length_33449_cov_1.575742:3517-2594(-)